MGAEAAQILAGLPLGYGSMNRPSPPRTDIDVLLARVARQDVEAFAALYDHTRARVYGLAIRVLGDQGYSEETTQEVYLHVWRGAAKFDPAAGSAISWLLTLAHRRAVERVRSEQAARLREGRYGTVYAERPAASVADVVIADDERRKVAECLGSLSDNQRECLELAYYQGLTYREVSERLVVKLSTIKSRMRDGLRALRSCLGVA